ncbi:tetratricopeptide repeat protein [Adhaeribacter radiodurans]|uniref:SH3 domain-containing protein n=1 Tax=Adhaeribacter radiodurans TaxID=2745197 RepID=A0A7L7L8X6_9BACT|nr:SH3 domain-containing protein [Adhaeribacter radiodurans]QMU29174.1 SH3 domain-containing protein [Adhaeribacter radiodurans]
MQNSCLKYLRIIFFFFFISAQPTYCQENKFSIIIADSLFQQKHYTEALAHYEKILANNQQYSPRMLLKMAFIKEGQHDFTGAMYYLHLYYSKTPNRAVLRKMEDLAQAHQLTGYEYSDLQFFKTQFNKYYLHLLEGMLVLAVIIITFTFFRRQNKPVSSNFKLGLVFYLGFILYYINYLDFGQEGIIRHNRIPVMSAPSAGATWLATANQGNKLKLTGEKDIWYEVQWKNQRAYIRKQNILVLP